jgi:hypothetical protein
MADVPMARPVAPTSTRMAISGHKIRVLIASSASAVLIATLAVFGWDYYALPIEMRPFSPKHELLRPSGTIGLNLGFLGVALFALIFLYALRKAIPWLGRMGTAKHWMDFHVVLGVTAPVIIAFHASFKFNNIAGAAFWVMLAVALSGIVGRYLYAQIPRSLGAAGSAYRELQNLESELERTLRGQSLYSAETIRRVFRMPSPGHIREGSILLILAEMLVLDLSRPWRVAALRRQGIPFRSLLFTLGGLLPSRNSDVEKIVSVVRRKALLTKRMLFLDRAQRIFHLWHVVHRPFSYAFVVLALIHIVNAVRLGYF